MEPFKKYLDRAYRRYFAKLVMETNGNWKEASKIAVIDQATIYRYYIRSGLTKEIREKLIFKKKAKKLIKKISKNIPKKIKAQSTGIVPKPELVLKLDNKINRDDLENNQQYINIKTTKIATIKNVDFCKEEITYKYSKQIEKCHIKTFILEHEKLTQKNS